jgi:EpsI family protein
MAGQNVRSARVKASIVLICAALTAGLASAWVPKIKIADTRPKKTLAELVPSAFGEWVEDRSVPVVLPAPDVQASLNKVYNQILARTYVNRQGYRIMLSMAYGGDQSDGMNVHRPEVCYPAQGFEVQRVWSEKLTLGDRSIPISRATTRLGPRIEPLTYWVVNGDKVIDARSFDGRIAQLSYTLRGKIPDGMLVRVSSIDPDSAKAFAAQDRFSRDMVQALDDAFRIRIAGLSPN